MPHIELRGGAVDGLALHLDQGVVRALEGEHLVLELPVDLEPRASALAENHLEDAEALVYRVEDRVVAIVSEARVFR